MIYRLANVLVKQLTTYCVENRVWQQCYLKRHSTWWSVPHSVFTR